jgi:hypothetical protein
MFNKWEAQRWWAENYDKVMELYNVQKFNQTVPLPATPKSEDEVRRPLNLFICFFLNNSRDYTPVRRATFFLSVPIATDIFSL